jgi:hypothetical protein
LRAREAAGGLLHPFLQLHVGIEQLLLFLRHLPRGLLVAIALAEAVAHLLLEFLLVAGELLRLTGQIADV